jgi:hypothetical protein
VTGRVQGENSLAIVAIVFTFGPQGEFWPAAAFPTYFLSLTYVNYLPY